MSVGLVIVSHSARLAEGVVELAGQMTQGRVRIIAAGGMLDGSLGTAPDRVQAAIREADSGAGVLVLIDLGSAVMSAEFALESLPDDLRGRVRLSGAPLVEGAVVAAVEASVGSDLAGVARAARSAGTTPKIPGEEIFGTATFDAATQHQQSASVLLTNRVGLHARPASLFVQTAARFTAQVTVQMGDRSADGKRILSILQLGARCGDTLIISASGPDADAAIAALVDLAQRKFDEE
jgi:dihydroxyacetone kinase phosphotransfer subunit